MEVNSKTQMAKIRGFEKGFMATHLINIGHKVGIFQTLYKNKEGLNYAKGETAQHLFGGGTIGTGFNPLTGPTQIQVSKVDLEEALELLKDLLE